ncbi:hypothetical protein PMZ80_008463 [Knufia obscura]|uniref:Uncharacterized protein n=1 Tax=Knufia obscura TaxID=1635080 RepID=A0ABR0REX7_9EURO|nr:hypothetical protein PMZ80_008463 [Knufia obscura]
MEGPRTFMNTPRELQDMVLHEYFRDVVITIYPALSDDETEERRKRTEPHPCLTIFHVSKGLHQLARAAFYRHATFHHWAPAISDDFNFWNRYRTGFPSKRFEKVSGDIDFALLLNKARVIVNADAATDLYEVKSMIETQFDIIKKWFDDVFENKLLKPRIWSDQTPASTEPEVSSGEDEDSSDDGSNGDGEANDEEEVNDSEEETTAERVSEPDVEAE